MKDDCADEAREDQANVLGQRSKVLIQIISWKANHVHEEQGYKGTLTEGRDDDMDQNEVTSGGPFFIYLDHLLLPLDMSLLILVDLVLVVMRLQLCTFKVILGDEGALRGLGWRVAAGWSDSIFLQNRVVYDLVYGQASEA